MDSVATVMLFLVVENKMNMFLEGPTGIIGLVIAAIIACYCYSKYPENIREIETNPR